MNQGQPGSGESKLETTVSYVLIIGVLVSLALEIAGIVVYARATGNVDISGNSQVYLQASDFFSFLRGLGTPAGNTGIWLMTLGIGTLILTPYIRVIASALYFAWRKDTRFLLITLFVLVVLTLSLALH